MAAYNQAKAGYEKNKMSDSAVRGRDIFFGEKGSCTACHVGPNLSDEKYHNLGIGMSAKEPDLGRYAITKKDEDRGAFKTPTIRNVAQSAPYMHDGSIKTLEEVIDWYDKGGHPNDHLDPKVKKLNLSKQDKADLLAFMQACTGDFPKIEHGRLPQVGRSRCREPSGTWSTLGAARKRPRSARGAYRCADRLFVPLAA